jgi:cyclic pyranopterin phosphate synthase
LSDEALRQQIAAIWQGRSDRYSELRSLMPADTQATAARKRVEMSYIGG